MSDEKESTSQIKTNPPQSPFMPQRVLIRGEVMACLHLDSGGGDAFSPSLDKGRAGEGLPSDSGTAPSFNSPYLPYNKNLTALARKNRNNPTAAENRIWQKVLRMRQFADYKFLRQKPVGGYIVDFYCAGLQLVIEIDGDSHGETAEYDAERTRGLGSLGLRVVRFSNDDVIRNIERVYEELSKTITAINSGV